MRAFVVLGLVFSIPSQDIKTKILARENISEMTYFVSSGTLNSVNQSISA